MWQSTMSDAALLMSGENGVLAVVPDCPSLNGPTGISNVVLWCHGCSNSEWDVICIVRISGHNTTVVIMCFLYVCILYV